MPELLIQNWIETRFAPYDRTGYPEGYTIHLNESDLVEAVRFLADHEPGLIGDGDLFCIEVDDITFAAVQKARQLVFPKPLWGRWLFWAPYRSPTVKDLLSTADQNRLRSQPGRLL